MNVTGSAIIEQHPCGVRSAYGRDQFHNVELFGFVGLAHSGLKYPSGCVSLGRTTSLINDEPGTARRFSPSGQSPINVYTWHIATMRKRDRDDGQIEFIFEPVTAVPEPRPRSQIATSPSATAQEIHVKPYRQRTGDRRFKQRVKRTRGNRCESCGRTLPKSAIRGATGFCGSRTTVGNQELNVPGNGTSPKCQGAFPLRSSRKLNLGFFSELHELRRTVHSRFVWPR